MRWKAAAIGGYHDGQNALADQLGGAPGPGQLSLAGRGFFSMDRWLRFSAAGAHLLRRVKNAARSVPFRLLRTLKDGPGLVLLRESGNMLSRRRKEAGDRALPRLQDTVARLVCFTILTRTCRGRTKAAAIRVLTALLDPDAFPAAETAALYAARWQVETAFFAFEENRPRHRPRAARPVRRPGQAGGVGTAPRAQRDRGPGRRSRGHGRGRPRRRLLHRGAVPGPRARRRRHLLPPLRPAPDQRRRPARPAHLRHRRPAAEQARQETNLRKNHRRTRKMAN